MRQYIMTGIGVLAGFFIGAFIFGALASEATPDIILAGELIFGTVGAGLLGVAGWFGAQPDPADKKRKKR